MWQFPQFDPVALQLGPLAVRWYGLMYLLGFAGGWWLARQRANRADSPITPAQVDDLIFYSALGVILGGRIGYMLFYGMDQLRENPLNIFRIWEGGMSFHGGFLGVLAALHFYAKSLGRRLLDLTDFAAPMFPVGLFTGRVGNFINGELWGKPTDGPWGVVVDGVARHPSQLYEAVLEGLVLFLLLWTYSVKPRPRLAVSGLFLLGYGVFRSAVEFVRLPDAHIGYLAGGWLTQGMVLTFPMVLLGIYFLWRAHASAAPRAA
jgi:phosphatidylglycerol---prolipoprotein diacylglyceryl transferase